MKKMWSCVSINQQAIKVSALTALLIGLAAPLHAGSPQWFRDTAKTSLPTYEASIEAVVLLDEQVTSVSDSGEVKTTYRVVKKILTAHGRDEGLVGIRYDGETKLSNLHAWSQPAQGAEYELKEKDAYETSMFGEELYSDMRTKFLRLPAEPGSIIGYEYEKKGRPRVFMDGWTYQDKIPVILSRYTLVLPPTWEMETYWVNRPKAEPQRNGNSFTWEERNIAAVKEEDSMPAWRAVTPRMSVAFFPSSGRSDKAHTSWAEVGSFFYSLSNPQRQATPATQAMANQLIAGKTSFIDKVRAIAAFAQKDVRYVAIEIGIGGLQPRTAESILKNRYGDCKDKATLMSSLLSTVGIRSYFLSVNTERGYVSPEAPSAYSFNHEIIAVEVPKGEKLPPSFQSVVTHSKLGTLLIFDPTDEMTPVGQLPPYFQSNFGLLVQEKGSDLIPLPVPTPESNGLTRTAKLTLSPEGTLSGEVREVRTGMEARLKRYQLRDLQPNERHKSVENFLSTALSAFSVKDFTVENLDDYDKDLVLTYKFETAGYSKKMGPMMLIRPRVFGSKSESIDFNKKDRKYPIELDNVAEHHDEFDITLPAGWTIDELPPPTKVIQSGLSYDSQASFAGQTLTYKRTYKVSDVRFPVEKFGDLRAFFIKVQQDERSSAVLKKQ
jgi:hypothetical protein